MLAIENWSKDKPDLIAAMAINMASVANNLFSLLSTLKSDALVTRNIPQPDLNEWLSLYKNPKRLQQLITWISPTPIVPNTPFMDKQFAIELTDKLFIVTNAEGQKTSIDCENNFVLGKIEAKNSKHAKALKRIVIRDLKRSLSLTHKEGNLEKLTSLLLNPGVYFAFKVFLPCWFNYRTFPLKLIREARHGDLEALEKLFRIDNSIIFDRKISIFIHRLRAQKPFQHSKLMSALQKQPKTQLSLQRIIDPVNK